MQGQPARVALASFLPSLKCDGFQQMKEQRFKIERRLAAEPMTQDEFRAARRILARMIARSYLADHEDLSRPGAAGDPKTKGSRPPSPARADAVAPTARDGGLDQWNVERNGASIGRGSEHT